MYLLNVANNSAALFLAESAPCWSCLTLISLTRRATMPRDAWCWTESVTGLKSTVSSGKAGPSRSRNVIWQRLLMWESQGWIYFQCFGRFNVVCYFCTLAMHCFLTLFKITLFVAPVKERIARCFGYSQDCWNSRDVASSKKSIRKHIQQIEQVNSKLNYCFDEINTPTCAYYTPTHQPCRDLFCVIFWFAMLVLGQNQSRH